LPEDLDDYELPLTVGTTFPYGEGYGNETYSFLGLVEDLRIYDRAITDAEVTALFEDHGYLTPRYPGVELIRTHAASISGP